MTSSVTTAPDGGAGSAPAPPAGAVRRWASNGGLLRWLGRVAAVIPLLMLGFVLITLVIQAIPAIK